ncbi:MAG: TonB-dependent receptor [Ignavibacteriaceae bacterium]
MKKYISLFVLLLLLSPAALPQNPTIPQGFNGTVKGKVVDLNSSKPIEYANIVLFNEKDSSMASGTVSDSKGNILLDKILPGKYYAKVSFMGFEPIMVNNISLTLRSPVFDFGTLTITPHALSLGDVNVTGEREMLTYNLDKKVIDVEKNLTSSGGTVSDVLQSVPSVNVDVDGGVSVRGNSNVTILIDGKPSGLAGISSSDVLTQIPASSVERIELVTNPSAKYDPEGTAGIINIVLKKKSVSGVNGFITLNAGTGDKYNSSLNLNYKTGPLNFYTSYDGRFNNINVTSNSLRSSFLPSGTTILRQDQSLFNKMQMHNGNAGLEFFINDLNTLSFNFQFRDMAMKNSGLLDNRSFIAPSTLNQYFTRRNNAEREVASYSYTLSYDILFETKGREWLTDIIYSDNKMHRDEIITQTNLSITDNSFLSSFQQLNKSLNTNKMLVVQSDYTHPFNDNIKVDAGFKLNSKSLTMDNNYYLFDVNTGSFSINPNPNYFTLDEKIIAAYTAYSHKIDKFSLQAGLRGESVINDSKLVSTGESFSSDYLSLYPSLHLAYQFSDFDETSLSFSRRVDRPSNMQLNPFVDTSDSLNVFSGNPKLKPQYTNSFEAGYSKLINKTSLALTLFYRNTTDIMSVVSNVNSLGVNNTTYANIAESHFTGAEFIWSQPIMPWWKFNANFSFFNSRIDDERFASSDGFNSWTTKITSNMNLMSDFQLQLFGNYNSASIMAQQSMMQGGMSSTVQLLSAQTETKENWYMDAAVKKDFFEGMLSLTLRVSDIFNTRKLDSRTTGAGFDLSSYRKMDSRVVYLGMTFRLNPLGMQNQKEKKPRDEGIDL